MQIFNEFRDNMVCAGGENGKERQNDKKISVT